MEITKPEYSINVKSSDISILRHKDYKITLGNYDTDAKFKEFCDTLSLRSCMRRCVLNCPKTPFLQVLTKIAGVKKDDKGKTIIHVPQNPFLDDFAVTECNFKFSKGQNISYTDSYPKEILVYNDVQGNDISNTPHTIIVEHYKLGWISKIRYDYHQLNLASRSIYDLLIASGFSHSEIYPYLQDVEELVKEGNNGFLVGHPKAYVQTAWKLAQEYQKIIKKSIMHKELDELDGLFHPNEVLNSPITKNPLDFVPSKKAISANENFILSLAIESAQAHK